MSTERKKTHGVANMIAGGVGGFFVVLTGHPFDTIKVRMQTARVPAPGQSIHFNGAIECLRQTVTKEGFTGLYKGMGAPLAGVSPLFALYFFGCSFAKRMQQKHPDEVLSTLQNFNAGAFAGFLTTVVIAPAERIKCLLQIQHDKSDTRFRGPIDVVKRLYKEGGIRSIYRGTAATLLRDVPASGAYFASYEYLMIKLTPEGKSRHDLSIGKTLFAGGMAGVCNWLIAIPPDVLKSRLQIAPQGKYPNGIRDVFREMIREESFRALYRGFTPVMLRAFPANAACFLGYELTFKVLEKFGLL